jgi:hypothetical protein
MAASAVVSIVTRHIFRTADSDKVFAIESGLNQTSPSFWEIVNELGFLEATVGDGSKDACAVADVFEHIAISKNGGGGLGIEEGPRWINRCVTLSKHDESVLK